MTRITSLSRKRTHNEAEFNNLFTENEVQESIVAAEEQTEQPKKKKRKYEHEKEKREEKREFKATVEAKKTGWGRSEEIRASAAASEGRRQKRIQDRLADTTCFACRKRGHTARDCPSNEGGSKSATGAMGICYRCGSSRHILSKCRNRVDEANPLPFASCFVCHGTGHLASTCSQNPKGVYPNGGSCKLCGQTDHLARNCPLRAKAPPAEALLFNSHTDVDAPGADEDDFMLFKRKVNKLDADEHKQKGTKAPIKGVSAPKKKVVMF